MAWGTTGGTHNLGVADRPDLPRIETLSKEKVTGQGIGADSFSRRPMEASWRPRKGFSRRGRDTIRGREKIVGGNKPLTSETMGGEIEWMRNEYFQN